MSDYFTIYNRRCIVSAMERELQSELRSVFRENMRLRRTQLRLSQVELAERLGTHQPYISDLESGRKSPLMETLAEIAEALETTPAKLLTPRKSAPLTS